MIDFVSALAPIFSAEKKGFGGEEGRGRLFFQRKISPIFFLKKKKLSATGDGAGR